MLEIQFLIRLVEAALLGAVIGVERQWRQRLAGLRTNALVALGAAAFVCLSALTGSAEETARITAQIVSGIGFLGAGVILRDGHNVRGLNTAATLWCSAAVGVLAGLGYAIPASMAAAVVLATNVFLRPMARRMTPQRLDIVEVAS